MISPGQTLDLSLQRAVVRDGQASTVTLSSLLRRRTVVSVYMRNNTGSCDRQIDSLVAAAAELDRLGCDVIAISRDTSASHQKYAAKKKVPFALVSDPDDGFARAADAIVEKSMYGKTYLGPARSAFILDQKGKVLAVIEKVDTKDHAKQLKESLKALA